MKRCTKCGVEKSFSRFNKDKSRRDGYRDRCKDCIRAYQAGWLPGYVKQIQAQRATLALPETKACTMCGAEKPLTDFHKTPNTADGRRPICKVCACAYQHEHRDDPRYREKVLAGDSRKYHSMPADKKKQSNRRIYDLRMKRFWNDPQFQARERIRTGHKAARYRLKRFGNGGSHTAQEWLDLCAKYDHRCLCCGLVKPLTRDHIVPVNHGGTDDISNIQPLCRPCNSTKGTQTIDYRPTHPPEALG